VSKNLSQGSKNLSQGSQDIIKIDLTEIFRGRCGMDLFSSEYGH
jgi:hypothetical protein